MEIIKETMTREQRMLTAVNLDIPDRTPVAPLLHQFCYRHKKIPLPDLGIPSNSSELIGAFHDTFDDLGGYDSLDHAGIGLAPNCSWRTTAPASPTISAKNFSTQWVEQETISFEDYDTIINRGWNGFCEKYIPRVTGRSLDEIDVQQKQVSEIFKKDTQYWDQRGVPVWIGAGCFTPEMTISLARTLPKFIMDVFNHPDKVGAVLEAMVPDLIQNTIDNVAANEIPRVQIVSERASGAYWKLDIFERLFFPPTKKLVNALVEAGIMCQLHLDTDYTKNLPYLRELPNKRPRTATFSG